MCKISCIIPVFNVEKYLSECIESILGQTFQDFEIIFINDGSTDNSLQILEKYKAENSAELAYPIKIINQENKGQGAARNVGIQNAKGKYLTFVDPDDFLDKFAFERLYKEAERQNADIVEANLFTFEDGEKNYKYSNQAAKIKRYCGFNPINTVFNYKKLGKNPFAAFRQVVCGRLYKSEFIKANKIKFLNAKITEDHPFSYKALFLADRISFLKEPCYYYRCRQNSSVHTKSKNSFSVFEAISAVAQILDSLNLKEKYKKAFSEYKILTLSCNYLRVPTEMQEKYKSMAASILSENEYKKFLKMNKSTQKTFLEKLFSVKNKNLADKKIKEITVLFFTFEINLHV